MHIQHYNRIHEIHILLLNIDYMYNEIKPLSSVQHTKKTHNTQRTPTLTHMSQLTICIINIIRLIIIIFHNTCNTCMLHVHVYKTIHNV